MLTFDKIRTYFYYPCSRNTSLQIVDNIMIKIKSFVISSLRDIHSLFCFCNFFFQSFPIYSCIFFSKIELVSYCVTSVLLYVFYVLLFSCSMSEHLSTLPFFSSFLSGYIFSLWLPGQAVQSQTSWKPGFLSQHYHSLALRPWASYFLSLYLSFLIDQREVLKTYCEDYVY